MPDFRDRFTAREVCEGMLSQINVHFTRARAAGKRSFRIDWQCLASFRTFGRSISDLQLICQIYRLICDRSHVHASHDEPGEQWNNRPWWLAHLPQRARFNACKRETNFFFSFNQVQTPVTLCSSELRSILVVRLAHSADLWSWLSDSPCA